MSAGIISPNTSPCQRGSASQPTVQDIPGPHGLLSQHVMGYESRPGQLKLAERIAAASEEERDLIAEGATGVGKSLAYLVPSILSGQPVIVSTQTTLLQDQLAHHDLPLLQRVLPVPFTFATIKGRSRYVCELEFRRFALDVQQQMALFQSPESVAVFELVERWVKDERAREGVAELDASGIAIPPEIKHQITTDPRHCLGRECPYVEDVARFFPEGDAR